MSTINPLTAKQPPSDFPLFALSLVCIDIRRGEYTGRYQLGDWQGRPCLFLKIGDVLPYLRQRRGKWEPWLFHPAITQRKLKRGLVEQGFVLSTTPERMIQGRRAAHLLVLDLSRLTPLGIHC